MREELKQSNNIQKVSTQLKVLIPPSYSSAKSFQLPNEQKRDKSDELIKKISVEDEDDVILKLKSLQQDKQQQDGEGGLPNFQTDTAQHMQEDAPHFSTDSEREKNPVPNHKATGKAGISQFKGNEKQLITNYGRQLSGNQNAELNFKRRINNRATSQDSSKVYFHQGRNSQPESEIESPIANGQGQLQKNPSMRMPKGKSMAPIQSIGGHQFPRYGQQKTINLNFYDELQLGLDKQGTQNLNFEVNSIKTISKQGKPFQDPDISVITKALQNDFEEDKIYESRELSSPPLEEDVPSNQVPQINTIHDAKQESQQDHAFIKDSYDEKQEAKDSKYNTQNLDNEKSNFLPQLNLLNGQFETKKQPVEQEKLDVPNMKKNLRRGSKVDLQKRMKIPSMKLKTDKNVMALDDDQNNSDFLKKFDYDINEKPLIEDKRAQQMIINQITGLHQTSSAKDNNFFMIVEKLPIENLENINGRCMKLKRCLCFTRININAMASAIIKSKIFESISLMVIMANSIFLAIEDPTSSAEASYQETLDTAFLILYSLEMVLKILGLGFALNRGAYLRDPWNILDFFIVMTGYLQLMLQGVSFNLSGLRVFRVLRPLKSISSVAGLKMIVTALLNSLPLLRDTIIVLFFFFFIFAIAGLQLFSGYLKRRCVNEESGFIHPELDFCGGEVICPDGFFCGKRNSNPDFEQVNFDNIFSSLIVIFTSVTLEGWTEVQLYIEKSFTNLAFIFTIPLVFIGAFFLMNLTMAVIQSKYNKIHEERMQELEDAIGNQKPKIEDYIDYDYLGDEAKKKRDDEELEIRNKVLQKWQMIIFIKQRMRNRVKSFRDIISHETHQALGNVKSSNTSSKTRLPLNYGNLFTNQVTSEAPDSGKEDSQRQLIQTQRGVQDIILESFSDNDRPQKRRMNFKGLNQDAIAEDEEENYTDLSHIIKKKMSSKKMVRGASGQSLKSDSNQDKLSRSSSARNKATKMNEGEGIFIESPGKKMRMQGMQGFKKKGVPNQKNSKKKIEIPPHMRKKRMYKIDEQFFLDFINKDLEELEKLFTKDELQDIALQLNLESGAEPQNFGNYSQVIEVEDKEKFSEISIDTEDFQSKMHHLQNSEANSGSNEDKNNTPYTSTTGFNDKGHLVKQRTRTTQMLQMSQDLSISDASQNDQPYDKINENPLTHQSINQEAMNSHDIPFNRQRTDFTVKTRPDPLDEVKISELRSKTTGKDQKTPQSAKAQQLMLAAHKTKEKMFKGISMGSSKILPYNISQFDAETAHKLQKIKFGANNMLSKDDVPVEHSVLNSRFLISDYLAPHQKVYLRKEKFDFTRTQEDIFQKREAESKQRKREEAKQKAISYQNNMHILPYERKYVVTPKIFNADEDQIEYLQHLGMDASELQILIQQQYNEPYITNLLVTGTLSIATKPSKENRADRLRKIQNADIKSMNVMPEDQYTDSMMNQSAQLGTHSMLQQNVSIMTSPMKRAGTTKTNRLVMKKLTAKQQLDNDLKMSVFFKSTSSKQFAKSKKQAGTNVSMIQNIKKRISILQASQIAQNSVARRQALLARAAAKDPALQRKLILTGLNKDAQQSKLFRVMVLKRNQKITQEEIEMRPSIKGMLEIHEDEDEEEKAESEKDSNDDTDSEFDEIQDDYLDWHLDNRIEVLKAKKEAVTTKKNVVQWSGQDVLTDFDPSFALQTIKKLSLARIWPKNAHGYWKRLRVPVKNFAKGSFFDNFLTAAVFINTVALALDRYGIPEEEANNLSMMNTIFTWVFIVEAVLKIYGLGIQKYLRDKMNYLDCAVVMLSIVEMAFLSGSGTNLSAFRAIRIFRIFRVLRVARLLKSMRSMQIILSVLMRSMDQFVYVLLLLLLFIFIYALLGMQVFGGNLDFTENRSGPPGVPITNFNSFNAAFLTTFQILTMEGWNYLFYDALRSGVAAPISALYFISWVFLGNFMLLNLFLAVLLEGFSSEEDHKDKNEDFKKLKQKLIANLQKKEGKLLIEYYQAENDAGDATAAGGLNKKKKKKKKKVEDHILDESFEYDQENSDFKKTAKKKKKLFEGIECENSMYILSKQNKVRVVLFWSVSHMGFEGVILVLIILSSIKLVIDTYLFDLADDDPLKILSSQVDYFFTVVFALESFLKSMAYGFVQDKGSYLRESWSQLDFFIVVTSIIDASFENINVPIIKILRLLRTLRPLRFISHNSGMKTIVMALLGSVGGIANVLIVVLVVWMIFAILAVNFYGGKMQYCTVDQFKMQTEAECLLNRGQWKTKNFNFDSVPSAMFTLFVVASIENWPAIMFDTINSNDIEKGPIFMSNILNGYFFVVYLLIGSFLFLNLFVGVIFKEFEDAIAEEKAAMMLKDSQIAWVDMMKMIIKSAPDLETTNRPKQKWRQAIHTFVTGEGKKVNWFDIFIMACIVLNMFQMAINYEGSSLFYNEILDNINFFFTAVFIVECLLKHIAFGFSYYRNSWNNFDLIVVIASILDIVMAQLNQNSLRFLRVGPQLARVMRVMRVSRLFRLVNKYKGIQALIQTIQFSLPALMNVFSLLMLVYFIFAVLACFLFRGVTTGEDINEFRNFKNFSSSLMMVMRLSTGENWNLVMTDCMLTEADGCIEGVNCGLSYAYIFFIPYMMISAQIMLNLFIMVIIQQFETYYLSDDNVMEMFKNNLELFKNTWTKFTRDQNCIKLKDTRLVAFFKAMDAPLGMKGFTDKDIIKRIVLMGVVTDEEGFVYFNELLFKAMRFIYGENHVRNRLIVEHELYTRKVIEDIKQKLKKKQWKEQRTQAAMVNPFMLQMYMNISFKAWLNQYRQALERRSARELISPNSVEEGTDSFIEQLGSQGEIQEDEWEYITDKDMEASDDEENSRPGEGSYYEEDDSNDENLNDDSRMIRQKSAIQIALQRAKSKDGLLSSREVDRIFEQQDQSRHNIRLRMKQESKSNLSPHSASKSSQGIDGQAPVQKRLSNPRLHVDIPKKRTSNSQQPKNDISKPPQEFAEQISLRKSPY